MRLQHKETLQIIEKSELNWKHLPNDRKELYMVLDGDVAPSTGKNFTPPELEKGNVAASKVGATDPLAKKPAGPDEGNGKAGDEETQDEKVLRLFKAGVSDTEEAKKELLKSIAKEVGAHFKTVESIINKAAKA